MFTFVLQVILSGFMKERLQKIISAENLSSAKFAEIIGVQRSSISHFLSGRNKPSYDVISSIMVKFPKINPDWLITGKGDMYRKPVQTSLFDQVSSVIKTEEKGKNEILSEIPDKKTNTFKRDENRIFTKEVERVIVFYKDKTFNEYKPE